jgi:hypothetical protein
LDHPPLAPLAVNHRIIPGRIKLDCGTGDGGFKPGNTCQGEGGGSSGTSGLGERAKTFDEWKGKLTPQHKKAFSHWGAEGYRDIRAYEAGKLKPSDPKYAATKQYAESLNEAIKNGPPHEGKVYRGLANVPTSIAKRLAKDGSTIELDAMSSTSTGRKVAEKFAHGETAGKSKGGNTFVIMEMAGKHGGVDIRDLTGRAGEREVLIPKGTKFKVKTWTTFEDRGVTGYRLQMEAA